MNGSCTKKETQDFNKYQIVSFVISKSELENIISTQDQSGLASYFLLPVVEVSLWLQKCSYHSNRFPALEAGAAWMHAVQSMLGKREST